MLSAAKLSVLNPETIIIPSLAEPERDYAWWRGVNLGRVAVNYLMSGGKAFSPPVAGKVHISAHEYVARQAASAEANVDRETYQMNEGLLEQLRKYGYEGDGRFPGLVVGLNPSVFGHSSLNSQETQNQTEKTLSMISMSDIDYSSQEFLRSLFQE